MKFHLIAPLALMLLVACDGNPFVQDDDDGGGGGGGGEQPDPSQAAVDSKIAVNLKAVAFDPADGGKLRITLDGIDATPVVAEFVRNPDLDHYPNGRRRPGYDAYVWQENGLNRAHLALVARNRSGTLQAAAVSDGGQFGIHYGGGHYLRIDTYQQPTTGLFSYTGSYAGVFVPGDTTTPGLPPVLRPTVPYRVTGDILVNASFADKRLNGGVTNRAVVDANGAVLVPLESLNLKAATIEADGRFLGDVDLAGDPPGEGATTAQGAGSYGGLFGGIGATDVAGALVINPIRGEPLIWEYGAFNLPRCGTRGEGPLCVLQ